MRWHRSLQLNEIRLRQRLADGVRRNILLQILHALRARDGEHVIALWHSSEGLLQGVAARSVPVTATTSTTQDEGSGQNLFRGGCPSCMGEK